jgi:RES domain-containing protein
MGHYGKTSKCEVSVHARRFEGSIEMIAWRIFKKNLNSEEALSGEGARRFSGRWNSKGNKVVYTASSKSQSIVEGLIQLGELDFWKRNYVFYLCKFQVPFK